MLLPKHARSGTGGFGAGLSYEDAEGMIMTGGVIAALVLSFSVALDVSVLPSELQANDFRLLVSARQDFREFVVAVMDAEDVGSYEHESYEWTVDLGGEAPLDMRDMLLVRLNQVDGCRQEPNQKAFQCNWGRSAELGADTESIFDILAQDFPMEYARAWYRSHPDALDHVTGGDWHSNAIGYQSALSVVCVFFSLWLSICLYISLVLAPAREDETGNFLKQWTQGGLPLMILMYVCLIVGVVLFFIAHRHFMAAKSENAGQFSVASRLIFTHVFIISASFMTFLVILNHILGICRGNKHSQLREAAPWKRWTSEEVAGFVDGSGFKVESRLFAQHKVSGALLPRMSWEVLTAMGLREVGTCMMIEDALKSLMDASTEAEISALKASMSGAANDSSPGISI